MLKKKDTSNYRILITFLVAYLLYYIVTNELIASASLIYILIILVSALFFLLGKNTILNKNRMIMIVLLEFLFTFLCAIPIKNCIGPFCGIGDIMILLFFLFCINMPYIFYSLLKPNNHWIRKIELFLLSLILSGIISFLIALLFFRIDFWILDTF